MAASSIRPVPRDRNPFSRDGVVVGPDGVPRYAGLPETVVTMLRGHVDATPDAEALVELGGARLTYTELWDAAARVAGGLRAAGVGPDDRVAIRYPAGANWVIAFFGTLMAGGVAVAPNIRSAAPEIAFMLEDAGVKVDLGPESPLPDGDPYVDSARTSQDAAAQFYTSGTTGKAKGVPTSHEAFLTAAENMARTVGLREEAVPVRTLVSVPLFHVTGCNAQLMTALHLGGTAVIMPTLDLPGLITALAEERISLLVTVPAVYALMLRKPEFASADVTGVRWVGYGGAPIAPSLVSRLQAAFANSEVFNGYGMTETASLMTLLPDVDAVEHADSVGYAVPSVDLGVLAEEDQEVGELVVRGANVLRGYWNRPRATAETIVDGWMRTGDIVRVDDAGRVHIVDRIKDIIIRGGENISSIEVESVLAAAPGVLEAAVLAVPDDVMGEKVGAVVYGEGEISVEELVSHCRDHLADFKVPQYLHVSDRPLPRNPSGKLLKVALRSDVTWGAPLR